MTDLYDESMDFEILGGLEFSEAEKERMVARAYELGLDLEDFETWEEIEQAINGFAER